MPRALRVEQCSLGQIDGWHSYLQVAGFVYPPDVSDVPASVSSGGSSDGRAARWFLPLLVIGVFVAVMVAAGVGRWVVAEREPAGARHRPAIGFACSFQGPSPDEGYCERAAADFARRAPLTDEQREPALALAQTVNKAAASAGWCMTPTDPKCARRPPSYPPGPEDVEAARMWLGRTGASDGTARLARLDDPAPAGSLLYAARVGGACIVGHVQSVPLGAGSHMVVGSLPDGSCLPK